MGEALFILAKLHPAVGRKKHAKIEIFAKNLQNVCEEDPHRPVNDVLDDMAANLALQVTRFWRAAKRAKGWSVVQPLGCFGLGDFTLGKLGELKPPSNTFNCDPESPCSAATYLAERPGSVTKLCEALHPRCLPDHLAGKKETQSRRAALKHLKSWPAKFDKRRCRALGDAYFAIMCPATAMLATSNKEDFEPLCKALGLGIVCPVSKDAQEAGGDGN